MYLTYAEYQTMGGTLPETTFNDYEFQAESLINWYTFNRLKTAVNFPPEVPRCMYSLIGIIQLQADAYTLGNSDGSGASSAGIASQSNDGVSVSYNVIRAQDVDAVANAKAKTLIQNMLNGVTNELGQNLLYRGLYPNERYVQRNTEG